MQTNYAETMADTDFGDLADSLLLQPDGHAALRDEGQGPVILLLHGGGGPATVQGLAQALAGKARVLAPTHPGFEGTPRPAMLDSVGQLARLYLAMLDKLELDDVIVIGSSIGGWIAAEMALLGGSRIKGVVLINAVGIAVPGEMVTQVAGLPPAELTKLAFHDWEAALARAPVPTPEQQAIRASNFAAMKAYDNGAAMMEPTLRARLASVTAPALVIWGESDGVANSRYGQAYAAAFANGRFELVRQAGHLPQIEQPARVLELIEDYLLE